MEVLYISRTFDYGTYEKFFTREKKPMHSATKYHSLLLKGLGANGLKVRAYSLLPANRENYDRLRIKPEKVQMEHYEIEYIPVWNLPVIHNVQALTKAFFKALCASRDTVVVYDSLTFSAAMGAVLGARLSGKKCAAVVTDLPEYMASAKKGAMLRLNHKLMAWADGYILLTEHMNERVNRSGRPYVVIEGLVDEAMRAQPHKAFSGPKKVLYAGSLRRIYGIDKLCSAFLSCGCGDAQLHVYGDGDYAPELRQLSREREDVFFHGNVMNQEVVEAELDAQLLVNPRPSQGEYTKYSFPSKTMEYMVSGTPVLTARLPGVPREYEPYLLFFEETENGLRDALKSALELPAQERKRLGARARDFVLREKNNVAQGKKAVELLTKLQEKERNGKSYE